MKNKIPIQNCVGCKVIYKDESKIIEDVKNNKNYKIKYKGFTLEICVRPGYYTGYITGFDKKLKKYFTKAEMDNLGEIDDIYQPHGGFTASNGFDCWHSSDINLKNPLEYLKDQKRTFKTHRFVESELKKIVNSLIKISKNRI